MSNETAALIMAAVLLMVFVTLVFRFSWRLSAGTGRVSANVLGFYKWLIRLMAFLLTLPLAYYFGIKGIQFFWQFLK